MMFIVPLHLLSMTSSGLAGPILIVSCKHLIWKLAFIYSSYLGIISVIFIYFCAYPCKSNFEAYEISLC